MMKTDKLFLLLCICFLYLLPVQGQESNKIPDTYTGSADSLAFYIDTHYTTDGEKLQTLYEWITTHMTYNVFPTFVSVNEERSEQKEIAQALKSRKGVCRDFALVFQAVGGCMDIPVYFVEGYTKSGGVVMTDPHAWCVALVDGYWYNYDPTFGMGYVHNQRFVQSPNMNYCKVEPEKFLHTHMPFDPVWQLTEHPLSYPTFDKGEDPEAYRVNTATFHFTDSIRVHLQQSPLQQLRAINGRIRHNGRPNPLVEYYLQLNTSNIEVYKQREVYDIYKKALKQYNYSVDCFNEVVRFHRTHSKPNKSERKKMLARIDEAALAVAEAGKTLQTAVEIPQQYAMAVNNLKQTVSDTAEKVRRKKESLR